MNSLFNALTKLYFFRKFAKARGALFAVFAAVTFIWVMYILFDKYMDCAQSVNNCADFQSPNYGVAVGFYLTSAIFLSFYIGFFIYLAKVFGLVGGVSSISKQHSSGDDDKLSKPEQKSSETTDIEERLLSQKRLRTKSDQIYEE